jgi:iron complex outermembrane receptor protein
VLIDSPRAVEQRVPCTHSAASRLDAQDASDQPAKTHRIDCELANRIMKFVNELGRAAGVCCAVVSLLSAEAGFAAEPETAAQSASGAVLDEIIVTADRKDSFSADYVQAGTFRNARIIETPLTVAVFTRELLDAQQALTLGDTVRNTAGVAASQINSVIYSNLTIRGIAANNNTNYRLNGVLPIVNLVDMPLENKDRVEVLKGASGLYYGFATPAGIVNLTTKRPSSEAVTAARVTANGYGTLGVDADFSRNWGRSGLRVNAVAATLENGIDETQGDRYFVSAAYDWRPTERFVLELDSEYWAATGSSLLAQGVPRVLKLSASAAF